MMDQREKLIEILTNAVDKTNLVDHLLANGVVVLPCRCKECEYSEKYGVERWCNEHQIPMGKDDFCSYGKRKSDIVDLCTTGHLHLGYVEEKGGDE